LDIIEKIFNAVVEGNVDDTILAVEKALAEEGFSASDVLSKGLIPAMDLVGEKFAEAEYFIPQVLWSAKAMQGAMDLLKPHLTKDRQEERNTVVIGTARGDIHDIGKNLVAIMLEGAGYRVIDLGVDVSPETFVEAALENKARIIAVSALLTTTMQAMAEVVDRVREKKDHSLKVLIGGAPVDSAFCEEIGADAYGIDAVDGVSKVKELMG